MKKIKLWIKKLKVWQKVLLLIVILGIVAFIIGLLVLLVFKISSSNEKGKLENYLTKVGYSCQMDSCTRTDETKKEEVTIFSDSYSTKAKVSYSVEVEDTYRIHIHRWNYEKNGGDSVDGTIIYANSLKPGYEETIPFIPESFYEANSEDKINNDRAGAIFDEFVESRIYWHEGDIAVSPSDNDTDLTSYVNDALREFESYFNGAKVKIN